jgi:potassium/chloride transporter 4/5/6
VYGFADADGDSPKVVEMLGSDISAYTIDRTRKMEERQSLLRRLRLNKKQKKKVIDNAGTKDDDK